MFETDDGKTTSKSSRLIRDTETSSNENIRYQAMDMIKKDTRVQRKESTNASRSNSMNTGGGGRRYYSSWDNMLERSEVQESKTNLLSSQQFGSTGSVNSYGSDHERQEDSKRAAALYQAAGHHLQLHAVHNTSYQTNTTLETCLESDENDLDDLRGVELYDVPRRSQASVKKSNSRVSSNGKLSLRVESFKQNKNSSSTQTDLSEVRSKKASYIGQYKKANVKQAPSKPVRKHKRKSSNGEARSPSPANSSTSGYSSPSLGLQSKESSPPLSKTPSPGERITLIRITSNCLILILFRSES